MGLGPRGFAVEASFTRVCREAGARVNTNAFVRDLNLETSVTDGRRLEIIANNLPLYNGMQFAIDTTLVSPVSANSRPHRNAHVRDGISLLRARRRKERTYHELMHSDRVRLIVIALQTGGRWSHEAFSFVQQLAHARARSEPLALQSSATCAWIRRWINIVACASQRAFALSLLALPLQQAHNVDGPCPFIGDLLADDRWFSAPVYSRMQ